MHFHRDFFLEVEGVGLSPERIKARFPKVQPKNPTITPVILSIITLKLIDHIDLSECPFMAEDRHSLSCFGGLLWADTVEKLDNFGA